MHFSTVLHKIIANERFINRVHLIIAPVLYSPCIGMVVTFSFDSNFCFLSFDLFIWPIGRWKYMGRWLLMIYGECITFFLLYADFSIVIILINGWMNFWLFGPYHLCFVVVFLLALFLQLWMAIVCDSQKKFSLGLNNI